jgi:hypothetical protein
VNAVSESNNFIFVKSITSDDRTAKKAAWPAKAFERAEYESTEDEEDWVSKEMKEQITETVSSIETKQLRDNEKAYVVLGVTSQFIPNQDYAKVRKQVFYPDMLNVLERLSAEVLSYLNAEHTKLLISCPFSKLSEILKQEKYTKKYFQGVKRISPLLLGEQVSKTLRQDSEWATISKDIIIQLIPNLPTEKRKEYSNAVIEHLKQTGRDAKSYDDTDFIIANLKQESTEQLLQTSNFVFRVSEIPKGVVENINLSTKKKRIHKDQSIRGVASSIEPRETQYDKLPIICLLDSGVNDIPQLRGLLIARDGHRRFPSFDDDYRKDGHGTPIAHLAVFGEDSPIPKARVISYKIYSDGDRRLFPEGYKLAINKYSSVVNPRHSRIFLSSITFREYDDGITASIDRWVQENNICMVFAAGNIDPILVSEYAFRGIPCASYISDHPVQDPAQAVNAVAVGAIAKKEAIDSISRRNELSPFTTCGTTNGGLYNCSKPEFVQHGGNCCKNGTILGVESFSKNGAKVNDLMGTSFAAPIFAHCLAEIYAKYNDKFENAETLKAIALALTGGTINGCMGFGETRSLNDFAYDLQALVCSEGRIPLPDTITEEHFRTDHTAKIRVAIPKFVNSIKMFLVHSDNHYREASPHLNTYLKVKAKKTARDYGYVELNNPDEIERKSNMKVFKWAFESQSMEGTWDFFITPEVTADMLAEHKKATTIRYGCALLVNSKIQPRAKPLTEEMYDLNKQIGVIT